LDDTISYASNSSSHLFENPGVHQSNLIIENEFGCQDSIIKDFNWQPAPPVILIAPDAEEGCNPLAVSFENLSSPIDSTYQIIWEMGDGGTSDEIFPKYQFDESGLYSIYVEITSPLGCIIDTLFTDLINVEPAPKAIFSVNPETPTILNSEVIIEKLSAANLYHVWSIDQNVFYNENVNYDFESIGRFEVTLTVEDAFGCMDEKTEWIEVEDAFTYFLPNAFTPNGDGDNEKFIGIGIFSGIKDFEMTIFDRWGNLIFKTNDPNIGWDGSHNNVAISTGVYQCIVKFVDHKNEIHNFTQPIVLIR